MSDPAPGPGWYWVYILHTRGGRLYTGCTRDLTRRLREHRGGARRARFTRAFAPEGVAGAWRVYGPRGLALRVEALIKRQRREGKERLLREPGGLADLVRRRLGVEARIEAEEPQAIA